ncbi:tryptophan synthase subunit alpha [[Clostridium] polysaccharolyticum]|jgi:tryptophan synthase alpha chain|uniref:Tryptophan synthase alpha chain n=1 Tax=[Clostridium] polysaccharolyticum TaxID=29364 RepID=A0A1I0C751_9FIRM|nr:tryptophan synthase subunit alpha [[Clostridium] polysaccharolyticum]SET15167.1 tryptophan synthase, alpha chain [[Clostridium] polysaccharolyticum]
MNRIEDRLNQLKEKGEKAFITYMTAGLPDMEGTKALLKAQEEAGTDIVEIGIPFSDPVADGPVIQDASYRSILKGTNLKKTFQAVKEVREECQIPIIFMMYYNTILHYGVKEFVEKCEEAGVDGLIVPDLPFEEQKEIKACMTSENAPILIELVSPVSKQRVPMILENARGFVYCVSSMGVTGQEGSFYDTVSDYLKEVKAQSKIPVMMGFGIKEAKDVEFVKDTIDGCIVGTHFIEVLEESGYDLEAAKKYIREFKSGLNG